VVVEKDKKLNNEAFDSKCTICGGLIKYHAMYVMCQNGKDRFFAHEKCMFPHKFKKEEDKK